MSCIAIIGGGSIGLRHNKILKDLGWETVVITSRQDLSTLTANNLGEAFDAQNISHVLVANETQKHLSAIRGLNELGFKGNVLVEKPFAIHEISDLSQFASVHCAFNLRFHPGIKALSEWTKTNQALSIEAYAGQHLSTWRPGRNHKETYSASKRMGGGVLRDLSHELDYLSWIFGRPVGVFALGGRSGNLTIDSDDNWTIVMQTATNCTISLQLNYFDKPGGRFIKVISEDSSFNFDFVSGSLGFSGSEQHIEVERDYTYTQMLNSWVNGDYSSLSSSTQAIEIEKLILDIERSAATKEWISR